MVEIKMKGKDIDASPDGINILTYKSKQKYKVPEELADILVGQLKVATKVKKKKDPNSELTDENQSDDDSNSDEPPGDTGGGEESTEGDSNE